jgi:hypothetical protein
MAGKKEEWNQVAEAKEEVGWGQNQAKKEVHWGPKQVAKAATDYDRSPIKTLQRLELERQHGMKTAFAIKHKYQADGKTPPDEIFRHLNPHIQRLEGIHAEQAALQEGYKEDMKDPDVRRDYYIESTDSLPGMAKEYRKGILEQQRIKQLQMDHPMDIDDSMDIDDPMEQASATSAAAEHAEEKYGPQWQQKRYDAIPGGTRRRRSRRCSKRKRQSKRQAKRQAKRRVKRHKK